MYCNCIFYDTLVSDQSEPYDCTIIYLCNKFSKEQRQQSEANSASKQSSTVCMSLLLIVSLFYPLAAI
jgi:hypothetical protein